MEKIFCIEKKYVPMNFFTPSLCCEGVKKFIEFSMNWCNLPIQ